MILVSNCFTIEGSTLRESWVRICLKLLVAAFSSQLVLLPCIHHSWTLVMSLRSEILWPLHIGRWINYTLHPSSFLAHWRIISPVSILIHNNSFWDYANPSGSPKGSYCPAHHIVRNVQELCGRGYTPQKAFHVSSPLQTWDNFPHHDQDTGGWNTLLQGSWKHIC